MDISLLQDFHPADTGLAGPVGDFARDYAQPALGVECDRWQFIPLLCAAPALRKVPGIPTAEEWGEGYFTALPQCATIRDAAACRRYLERDLGVKDKASILDFCRTQLQCHDQYLEFESFWEGRPPFALSALPPERAGFFTQAMDFAAQFYPIVGRHGFLGWDIGECIGLMRACYACGVLTKDELEQLAWPWVIKAQTFESWGEFAVSMICGELYFDFRQRAKPDQMRKGLEMWLEAALYLLENQAAWGAKLWYAPPRKKPYRIQEADYRTLLTGWRGPNGCFATDHITVIGKKVGWCYRETPDPRFPDSGWRFFSGDESDAYVRDPHNTDVYALNTICNYDPEIIPLLTAPIGSAFVRGLDGGFAPAEFPGQRQEET